MKEVKQAWTSLLSSRNLMTSGTVSATANSNGSGNSSCSAGNSSSRATWYDAPTPVIIHGHKFDDDEMDNSGEKIFPRSAGNCQSSVRDMKKSIESAVSKDSLSNRRNSKDSGIETIASLRRTFLDEFRKSNIADDDDLIASSRVETKDSASKSIRGQSRSTTVSGVGDVKLTISSPRVDDGANSHLPDTKEEVLYQNNVEAALHSLSKVCVKELDISVESTNSKKSAELDDPEDYENNKLSDDDTNGSIGFERRRRRRRKSSSGSRRHSSSVELTAMTTIKTDDEGVPTISFSFMHKEENNKPYLCDIPLIDDDDVATGLGSAEQLDREQLYDFPKSGPVKRVVGDRSDRGAQEHGKQSGEPNKVEKNAKVELPVRRLLGDGVANPKTEPAEDQLYDFPKNSPINVSAESKKITRDDELSGERGLTRSPGSKCSIRDEEGHEERLYESPIDTKNLTVTKDCTLDRITLEKCQEVEGKLDKGDSRRPRDQARRTFRSLRSGRSVPRIEIIEPESPKGIQAYYSDPECQDGSGNIDGSDSEECYKGRKHHRRLGKAWGKMRSWLKEEKSRFGEVVNRHARMQAVGAHRAGKSENGTTLGSRTGSYDLAEARTRELGSITRVEEFGLSSVSEEGNASDSERLEWTSYDLLPNGESGSALEIRDHEDDDPENKDRRNKRNKFDCSPNESPDDELASGRSKKLLIADNVFRGAGMKLTPISFSADKLCNDEVNEDGTNGIVGRRDSEQTTTTATTTRDHVGKGGLIKRRMLGSIRGLMASTHLLQQHEFDEGGPGGFEDVRRYVKQGGDFCKELAAVLHERAELEASYSKGLSKLSAKLTKACTKDQGSNGSGGVTEAWRSIGEEMEAAAEAHRAWGIALSEQLAKPLRVGVAEAQGRSRKVIESSVDKASKSLQEWRGIAAKSKKQSFACARENERLQDLARIQSISQTQQNNNKTSSHHMTEKEVNKLETRRRKAEDSSRRADTEFYTVSVRAERARLEYESTVRKGAKQMELLEEERLSALKDLGNVYLAHLQALAPKLQQSADRLSSPVRNCSVSQDVDILKNVIRRLDSNDGSNVDQLLPDFYAEHVTLAMNRERRKQSLVRVLHLIRQDLERERRGREGLETLHRAFIQTPAFAADESTQNVTEKLHHMRSMLTFLEAARYKVGGTLAEVEGGKRGKHPLAEHILVSRDKQGLQQSVLKVPSWAKNESFEFPEVQEELEIHLAKDHETERRDWVDRTAGDGNSENPPDEEDFSDFDEFSSQSEDNNNQEVEMADMTDKVDRNEQCRAIYQYSANLNDELSLTPGDLITIHEKQADGWWIGECSGRTGIFPATYVQLIH